MNVLLIAMSLSAWCNDEVELVPDNFPAKTEIQVWISTESDAHQNALTTTTSKTDGTKGVNIGMTELERHVRVAVNTINGLSIGLPTLVYAGQTDPDLLSGNDDILLESPPTIPFNAQCGSNANACFANPSAPTFAVIQFRGTSGTSLWKTTPTYATAENDFTGVLLHEIFHVFGLFHSDSPSACGCGTAQFPNTRCDTTVDPRSIMNVSHVGSSSSGRDQMRWPTRDDIEGLRDIWNHRLGTSGDSYYAYDPSSSWTAETGGSFGVTSTRSPISVSSQYADSSRQKMVLAHVGGSSFVKTSQRSGLGSWSTLESADTGTSGISFARPGVAYGNDRVLILWVDESLKSYDDVGGYRLRKATRLFTGSTFTTGFAKNVAGTDRLMFTPEVHLGFDPVSNRFLMTTMGDGTNRSRLQVSVLNDSGDELGFTISVSTVADILAVGKPVCLDSGASNCAIPFVTSPDRGTPFVKYALGHITSNAWVQDSIVSGNFIGYGEVDHAFASDTGLFSVSWQTLSGKTVIHKRASITSGIDTSAEFNTNLLLPAGLGSNEFTLFGTTSIRHTAFIVTSW